MLVELMPGANRAKLPSILNQIRTALLNLPSSATGQRAVVQVADYLNWTIESARLLHNQISAADIDRLVFTKRFELVLNAGPYTYQRALMGLLRTECDERAQDLAAAAEALERENARWNRPDIFVLPDTSFYITHPDKLAEMDLAPLIDVYEATIHLVVPIVVVDELDALKQSKDKHTRWRAGHTLGKLDELIKRPSESALVHAGRAGGQRPEDRGRGDLRLSLLFDPPGHVRLPINDDEIIDRALTVAPFVGGRISLVTYDTGQAMRARAVGLQVFKLPHPSQNESESV